MPASVPNLVNNNIGALQLQPQTPQSGLLPSTPASSLTQSGFASANTAPKPTGGLVPAPSSTGISSNQYQMTPQEMSGGAAGIQAYQMRISGLRSSTGASQPQISQPTPNPASGLNLPNNSGTQGPTTPNQMNNGVQSSSVPPPPGKQYMPDGSLQAIPGYVAPTNLSAAPGTVPGLVAPNPQSNAYSNTGAPGYGATVGALASTASQTSPQFDQANQVANQALQDLQTSRTNEAQALANNSSNPIPLEFQQGRGQVLQNQYLAQQNAYAGTYQGAVGLEGAATGQQGTQQSGLAAAAGAQAPQAAGALGTYNPVTGQYSGYGGGTVDPNNPSSALFSAGGIGGTMNLGSQYTSTLLPAYNAAGAILNDPQNGMDAFLKQHPEINPDTLRVGNQLQQWVQGQMSDPNLSAFNQKMNEFLSTATPLVGVMGGMTNFKQSMVNSMLDAMAQGKSVSEAMHSMYDLMGSKLNAIKQSGGTSMGTGSTSGSSGGAGSVSVGGYNFVQGPDGTWKLQ